jgi:predicted helicase
MSTVLINQYYQNLDRTLQFGKSRNEQSIRNHFWSLLNDYARKLNYEVVAEVAIMGTKGKKVYPDGTVKNLWGLDIGLWESKDEKDDIEAEIDAKIKKGYPLTNILFEDSNIAVLFQRGEEVDRVKVRDADKFDKILTDFISFKSETVYKFEDAIEKFKADIPIIVKTLRNKILESREKNKNFLDAQASFFELCKVEINPDITIEDIREMLIQHLLTSDIFNKIFDDSEFHLHNTIAAELEKLIGILFTYAERKNLLYSIEHYYEAINATAASITDHHEKQKFLKVLYENFYKVYNPKAADRLGVVYTPNEIVQFMVQSTNYLLQKYFGKTLADKNVEILDPATGTATFICEIIENAIPKNLLEYKFKNEIHANEVAILPYYIANLNIEFTFKQKMQYYAEFPNLCFVDTIDNIDALAYSGKQHEMFGVTSENTERIKRQNSKKISVIIGNPPYNANQLNENENNKNREYPSIDKRIKDTYVKYSFAQKTKVYDMYARFYRWAMDRIGGDGIISFVTNNSFVKADGFDGFRKSISNEFSSCYVIDLAGDYRTDKEENVFGIKVGVCITFLIKEKLNSSPCKIYYYKLKSNKSTKKLDILSTIEIKNIDFENVIPNTKHQWLEIGDNNFDSLFPLVIKGNKTDAIISEYSNGVSTNRDDWVYELSPKVLETKIKFFIEEYNNEVKRWNQYKIENKYVDIKEESNPVLDSFLTQRNLIKWSKMIKRDKLRKGKLTEYEDEIRNALYRPFSKKYIYFGYVPIDMKGAFPIFYPKGNSINYTISISNSERVPLSLLASNTLADLNIFMPAPVFSFSLYFYNKQRDRIDNITDMGLERFKQHYIDQSITKENIFHYVYGTLHNPFYRIKYGLNLKRDFPRIPFYSNFQKWATWGKALMDLHINYESAEPYNLQVITTETKAEAKRQKEIFSVVEEPQSLFARKPKVKTKLKAIKEFGIIEIDELTFIKGVPKSAWDYKLGNRSALEWVLDQYKEKKPKDPTIAEKFNTYRFTDYKDKVIDLLKRVCTVSVETVKIVSEMQNENE